MKEPPASDPSAPGPSLLDRGLGLLTEVRPGEGLSAVLLALDVCLLLSAYYVLKPVREALILTGGGAEIKSYASLGQVVILSALVPAYAWLVERVPRGELVRRVTFLFIGCLALFYFAAQAQVPGLGVVFFLWVGIFNLMVVAQFWALASDLYTREQGERLFPLVAFGASSGAVIGSWLTSLLVEPLGVPQMLLVSAGLLFVALLVTRRAERAVLALEPTRAARRSLEPASGPRAAPSPGEPASKEGAFTLVFRSRYLLLLAALMLLSNWVNTTGEFLLSRLVEEEAQARGGDARVWIGAFYSEFFFWVNLVAAVVQLFVAPRLIRRFGVSAALLVLPVIALGGYLLLAAVPILLVARFSKTAENSTNYSLQNTVRNALFLPLSVAEKYKAKQAIDSIGVRLGDVLSAGLVFVGLRVFDWSTRVFALWSAGLVGLWLVVALALGRQYRQRVGEEKSAGRC